ncbi:MAG TPA: metallophosphoesterase [Steroidobacteraceae bacterium]|nr:metallophosphoesterase [Steroidobacteraceae bacterium]
MTRASPSIPLRIMVGMLALLLAACALCAETDGPYVVRNAEGRLEAWSVDVTTDGARRRVVPVAPGSRLIVAAVGSLPAFEVTLRPAAQPAAGEVADDGKAPVFVVADTHGEFEILAAMLQEHGVIDERLHWKFGRGRLLFLGDAFDRGAHQLEILWLVYELEAQARQAGGAVHFVLGNHEVMALQGDARYLNPRYRATVQIFDVDSYARLFAPDSVLGQWLRSRPALLKLGDLLCVHGGLSPGMIERKLTIREVNASVRGVLSGAEPADAQARELADFLFGREGPLWYRGYFAGQSGGAVATRADVERILQHFGARRILVGHTRVPTITPLYEGRVVAVQVYPRHGSFGYDVFEALLIRDGALLRAQTDGRTEPLLP